MDNRGATGACVALSLIVLSGCATVPKETVALSVAVGEDIQQLYSGYKSVVRLSFDQMRRNGLLLSTRSERPPTSRRSSGRESSSRSHGRRTGRIWKGGRAPPSKTSRRSAGSSSTRSTCASRRC